MLFVLFAIQLLTSNISSILIFKKLILLINPSKFKDLIQDFLWVLKSANKIILFAGGLHYGINRLWEIWNI